MTPQTGTPSPLLSPVRGLVYAAPCGIMTGIQTNKNPVGDRTGLGQAVNLFHILVYCLHITPMEVFMQHMNRFCIHICNVWGGA